MTKKLTQEQKIQEAKQLLADDKKQREDAFNKELVELKKKWKVEQHPTVDNTIISKVVEALTSVPMNIISKAKD